MSSLKKWKITQNICNIFSPWKIWITWQEADAFQNQARFSAFIEHQAHPACGGREAHSP